MPPFLSATMMVAPAPTLRGAADMALLISCWSVGALRAGASAATAAVQASAAAASATVFPRVFMIRLLCMGAGDAAAGLCQAFAMPGGRPAASIAGRDQSPK